MSRTARERLEHLAWPLTRMREAMEAVLLGSGLPVLPGSLPPPPDECDGGTRFSPEEIAWWERAPRSIGFEGRSEVVMRPATPKVFVRRGPMVFVVRGPGLRLALALVGEGKRCRVIGRHGSDETLDSMELAALVLEATNEHEGLARIFEGLSGGERALDVLATVEKFATTTGCVVVTFELATAHRFTTQLRHAGAARALAAYAGVSLLQAAVAVGAALTLGGAALTGRVDVGRIVGWSCLAFSDVPLQFVAATLLGRFSVDFGALLKRRLLEGTFFTDPDELRREGFGTILARLNEASIVERMNVVDVFSMFAAVGYLAGAVIAFANAPYAAVFISLLAASAVGVTAVASTFWSSFVRAYNSRATLTEDLVDKIIGHRTRITQEHPAHHADGEDDLLHAYAESSRRHDRINAVVTVYGRVWLLFCGGTILTIFIETPDDPRLAYAAVGAYLAQRGFVVLFTAVQRVVPIANAWRAVKALFSAGRSRERLAPTADAVPNAGEHMKTILTVSSLSFAHRNGTRPILRDAKLTMLAGERVLIEGPSGSGKTTFATLLAGERAPTAGTILVDGIDFHAVSETEWRRKVAFAPQFHENYVFSSSLAFNLDPNAYGTTPRAAATQICDELGLSDVIGRMPAGFGQILGETGWQLSHGERSRLFIARSLLQDAEILVFDESFGALDPETLQICIACVRRRARSLIVIAHT